ncbi:malic protein NAD-binding protein [Rickettsiales bacterium]|nr:malic protein NAD-binding protein [Rickettsiales bacterium]
MTSDSALYKEALEFHKLGNKPGKISLAPTKPLLTQGDLSLAYSPGVAAPCLEIAKNPDDVYEYTSKGNLVAVVSNGTAVLGLGNLGPLASKPVMEGKSVLFKRFADIDSVDIEVSTENIDEFVNAVKYLGNSWGGINLEDIKSPECFAIEKKLKEVMDIPVFHDDQHGTAIIVLAGIINACEITGRSLDKIRIVINGPGAAGIACCELLISAGVLPQNIILCDHLGVVYKGREKNMNEWKRKYAADINARNLAEALEDVDVFLGLSVKDVLAPDMLMKMRKNPIIFAMANPDPEIKPEIARKICPDAIIATGRSDYSNQINNVMGFPYIFRGALDSRAKSINQEMKIAAAHAIANLAHEAVPDEVLSAYSLKTMQYGPEYIIPTPFDPRLIHTVPPAVAKAACESGIARKKFKESYVEELKIRLNPAANTLNLIYEKAKNNPKRVIFAEGEEEKAILAALQWRDKGYGQGILVGDLKKVQKKFADLGIDSSQKDISIVNAAISNKNDIYIEYMYKLLQRRGFLHRDCVRAVKNKRNTFAACMLACGDGDILVTGLTRSYLASYNSITQIIEPSSIPFGLTILVTKERTVFIADTAINQSPTAEQLAKITIQAAKKVRQLGCSDPRVAFLSYASFGSSTRCGGKSIAQEATEILDKQKVDFEYEGEIAADFALDQALLSKTYPFCRLTGPANILIMPDLNSANISCRLIHSLTKGYIIGPILVGLPMPVQILQIDSTISDILSLASWASIDGAHI